MTFGDWIYPGHSVLKACSCILNQVTVIQRYKLIGFVVALLLNLLFIPNYTANAFSFKAIPAAPQPGTAIGETADTTNVRWFMEDCSCISPASTEVDGSFTQSTNIVRWDENTQPYNNGVCVCRINIPSTGDYCVWPYYRGGGAFLVGLSDVRSYLPGFWSILPSRSDYGFNASSTNNLNLTPKKIAVGSSGEQNLYIQGSQDTRIGAVYFGKVDGSGNCTATPSLPAGEAPFTPDYTLQTIDPAPTINGTFTSEDDWVNAVNFPVAQTNDNTIQKATCLWNDTANSIYCGFEILDEDIQTGGSTITTRDRVEVGVSCDDDKVNISTDTAKYIVDFLANTQSKKWSGTGFTVDWTDGMQAAVTDITGGKRIEFSANLPCNVSPNQRGLVQFANPDRESDGTTTIALAYGSGNLNSPSQWGTTLFSTTEPTPPALCTTQPTVTSTSETDITSTSARLCVNGIDITCASQATVVWEWGTATGNYNLTQATSQTVSDGGSVCQLVQNLPANDQIFWRASVNDGVTAAINTTEDNFTTLAESLIWVATTGNDSTGDGSSGAPYKTITKGVSVATPGKTVIIKDGTYVETVNINCSSNTVNGTQDNPITVKAENERQVFIKGNGSNTPVSINNCSWWVIEGLRAQGADNPTGSNFKGDIFNSINSNDITFKRNIGAYPNRYYNSHVFRIELNSARNVLEENEAYHFHRHGINVKGTHTIVRRNYINSRDTQADIDGGDNTHRDGGDEGIAIYDASDSIVENNIVENSELIGGWGDRNKFLGNVSINNQNGFAFQHHCCANIDGTLGQYKDNVAFNNVRNGWLHQSETNQHTHTGNSSIANGLAGFSANNKYSSQNKNVSWTINPDLQWINALSLFNGSNGFFVEHAAQFTSIVIDYPNAFGNGTNYGTGTTSKTNSLTTNPDGTDVASSMYGTRTAGQGCIVYIPAGNEMKNAGKDGEDIGANIIYRYEEGNLTSNKLWNQSTGQFTCGATINDSANGLVTNDANGGTKATNACINVHKRLNVGVNGCAIP